MTEEEIARNQLILGMQYRAWKDAELGFITNLVKMYAAGMTKREIAIACGVQPKDAERMLDSYGPAVRAYLQDQPTTQEEVTP